MSAVLEASFPEPAKVLHEMKSYSLDLRLDKNAQVQMAVAAGQSVPLRLQGSLRVHQSFSRLARYVCASMEEGVNIRSILAYDGPRVRLDSRGSSAHSQNRSELEHLENS